MNLRDAEVIAGLLRQEGFGIAADEAQADAVVFVTCSVRQHAEDKVWSEIGRISKLGRKKPGAAGSPRRLIGLCGCMAQNYKEQAFERSPAVDFVAGPSDIDKVPGILERLFDAGAHTAKPLYELKVWETEGENRPEAVYHTGHHDDKEHAYVVISEGCSNFCSYCVVPYVRGPLRNRPHAQIIREIRQALDAGITRITLLGQNVNAYCSGSVGFVQLLEQVNTLEGLVEFSFITSHPKDTTDEVFRVMAGCARLKKYLHLPVQSGSNAVLARMNRGYTREMYLGLVDRYRALVPAGVLTTDVIVGFPGESDKDFQDSYDLLAQVRFDAAFLFKYSPRPHAQASQWVDDVSTEIKEKRHRLVLELQRRISKEKAKERV